MQQYLTRMNVARILVIFGFIAGLRSVYFTWSHIGSDLFLLTPESPLALTHSWHHFFRELFGDFGAMIGVLILLWLPSSNRSPKTWWVMLVLLLGFYAPFWVGAPFMIELAAPNIDAEIQHVIMALPPLVAVFLVRKDFYSSS
ncbi:MAG: hypothetical protein P8M36_04470 [Gammaproteobacteria bacterium]|nr:hypothetical protein [Gammaproteobacteria bacterium]